MVIKVLSLGIMCSKGICGGVSIDTIDCPSVHTLVDIRSQFDWHLSESWLIFVDMQMSVDWYIWVSRHLTMYGLSVKGWSGHWLNVDWVLAESIEMSIKCWLRYINRHSTVDAFSMHGPSFVARWYKDRKSNNWAPLLLTSLSSLFGFLWHPC